MQVCNVCSSTVNNSINNNIPKSKAEKLNIVAQVADQMNGCVCTQLLVNLGLDISDDEVADVVAERAIRLYDCDFVSMKSTDNLLHDQEYAVLSGLLLGINADFCLRTIFKHYLNQQKTRFGLNTLKDSLSDYDWECFNSFIMEAICTTILEKFDLSKNNALVPFLNFYVKDHVIQQLNTVRADKGYSLSKDAIYIMRKVERWCSENHVDIDNATEEDKERCYEDIKKSTNRYICLGLILETFNQLQAKLIYLDNDTNELNLKEAIPSGEAGTETKASVNVLKEAVAKIVCSLDDVSKDIVIHRMGYGDAEKWSIKEFAEKYDLSERKVRTLEKHVKEELREMFLESGISPECFA